MLNFFLGDDDDFGDAYDADWIAAHRQSGERADVKRQERRETLDANKVSQVKQLERRVEKLRLATRALCELLTERTQLTEKDILDRIDQIDYRDGQMDGRLVARSGECKACQRNNGAGRTKCQYCGEPVRDASGLDGKI